MFPRLSNEVTTELQVAQKRFLVRSASLEIDRSKCRNCGTCISACPNNIIKRGIPGATQRRFRVKKPTISVVLDAKNCSYCGVCSYLCPYDALSLVIDGKKVPHEKLQLCEKKALPRVVAEEVELKDGQIGRKFMEGYLNHSKDTCQEGCRICTDACPTGALSRYLMLKSTYNPLSKFSIRHCWMPEKLEINRDRCIQCGACAFACPVSSIKMFRQKIKTDGAFLDPFWPSTQQRLLNYHGYEKET
jgi:4Fe-4S ferredoxin